MQPIDKRSIKKFREDYYNSKTSGLSMIFLKDGYELNATKFHKLFLHSGISLDLNKEELTKLLNGMSDSKMIEDIEFIIHLKERMVTHSNKIKDAYAISQKEISIEDLFNYLEFIKYRMVKEELSIDNKKYPKEILNSQYNHILDSFPEILKIIQTNNNFNLSGSYKVPKNIKQSSKEIFEAAGFKSILRSFILQLSMEHINATKTNDFKIQEDLPSRNIFHINKNLNYWTKLEKYRDLNYYYQEEHSIDTDEKQNLVVQKQILSINDQQQIFKMDLSKGDIWESEYTIRSSYKLLVPIYGGERRVFKLKGKSHSYSIEELLTVYSSIYKLALDTKEKTYNNSCSKGFIKIIGKKSLIKTLKLDLKTQDLLELFTYDLNNKKIDTHLANYKPLIKINNVFFILPNWIISRAPEKVIDKILVGTNIELQSNNQIEKGHFFESTIETFFKTEKITFSKLERDADNDLPEIDGMFILGNYLFLFEAKATIKPESIMEAYNSLQEQLYKAFNQLQERTKKISINLATQKLIKEKTGIDVSKKTIVPFILLNHSFFNGYQEFSFLLSDKKYSIPVIDFYTLKEIIKSKTIPIWQYNEVKNSYLRTESILKNFESGETLHLYLLNQIQIGLPVEGTATLQLLEDGILYPIVKPLNFSF
ncbi:hypothetical protein P4562_06805 [Lysinibacillus xylanilyticus]|uniref:hypothetical protein n=1 Tax=Lysinibacillus xylanilyticus TaxID=582475 RepID=UPI002E227E47|nr:hypothetical protein [Lysinibacillus xylanilyticus]